VIRCFLFLCFAKKRECIVNDNNKLIDDDQRAAFYIFV